MDAKKTVTQIFRPIRREYRTWVTAVHGFNQPDRADASYTLCRLSGRFAWGFGIFLLAGVGAAAVLQAPPRVPFILFVASAAFQFVGLTRGVWSSALARLISLLLVRASGLRK